MRHYQERDVWLMKTRNPEAVCRTCPFWHVHWATAENAHGECRKRPPDAGVGFAETTGVDWCGEHPDILLKPEAPPIPPVQPLQPLTMGSKKK